MSRLVWMAWGMLAGLPVACVGMSAPSAETAGLLAAMTSAEGPALFPNAAPEAELPPPTPLSPADCPFTGREELSAEAVIGEVLRRNQTLAEMTAAWQASLARYPQVTSLDDPMLQANFAPAAMGGLADGSSGYAFMFSQKYPWPGKLKLRGDSALAQTKAAGNDVEDTRLQLVETARDAFADYYLVYQALAVNEEALKLLHEFRQNAETRYRTGLAPQQDLLQADVEIGRRQERGVQLERARRVTIARLNTLMHLPPDRELPPPSRETVVGEPPPDAAPLRAQALERRPDLKALGARIVAEEASLALAYKEFCPDLEPTVAYDNFWTNRQQQYQIGLRLNLPVRLERRKAAVAEAQARIAQRRAELARQIDQVNYLVQQAYEQVHESARVVRLYERKILPAARENVQSAQAAYVTGKIPFLSLIEAERDVIGLRDRYYETVADYLRRSASLQRAMGEPSGGAGMDLVGIPARAALGNSAP